MFNQNVSPCWQGIVHGLELLKNGIIWRVVNGRKIRIWRDNWLPRGNHKVISKANATRVRWVSDLIDPSTNRWNEGLVQSIFYPPDAEEIMQIPVPSSSGDDFISWTQEKNGIFSVRSAYKLGMHLKKQNVQTACSNKPDGERDLWKLIWNANVPPKIKIFGWKLATNSLEIGRAHV